MLLLRSATESRWNVGADCLSHRTPLHCAASCNDRPLCEFLVRSGGAVMAMTESDGATASQKCDPYAVGFEECEHFLRGEECTHTPKHGHTCPLTAK